MRKFPEFLIASRRRLKLVGAIIVLIGIVIVFWYFHTRPLTAVQQAKVGSKSVALAESNNYVAAAENLATTIPKLPAETDKAAVAIQVGKYYQYASEYQTAKEWFENAKSLYHSAGDKNGEAIAQDALDNLASISSIKPGDPNAPNSAL